MRILGVIHQTLVQLKHFKIFKTQKKEGLPSFFRLDSVVIESQSFEFVVHLYFRYG
jgi:hypothetical protein